MNGKDFKKVILFMANQWDENVAKEIFGSNLGAHFWSKWKAETMRFNADMGTMRLFYEMTDDNLDKLVNYILRR